MSDMQRETLFRSATFHLRDDGDGGMPTMSINFARFDEWTEIRDIFEGHFMERFAPGSFKKTFSERGSKIKVLFQHGQDPQVGKKPLGAITDLREEKDGAWADVKLLDADYVRELLPAIKEGLLGASMAFKPLRTEDVESPARSAANPAGVREVTVKEAMLREFGPVTFPAYDNTSVGVRALTADLILDRLEREDPDKIRALLKSNTGLAGDDIGPKADEETSTETQDTEEQAPAERATPAPRLVRVGDQYLPLKNAA